MRVLSKREEDILVFAFRYALTRVTGAPAIVAEEIRAQMRRLSIETRAQMAREIREERTRCSKHIDGTFDAGTWEVLERELTL
jgi:hypothetical protein